MTPRDLRRACLAAGAIALVVAERRRARAIDPGASLEVGGYEGSASGRFGSSASGCSAGYPPAAGVRYVGGGAIARLRPSPKGELGERGSLFTAGATVEYQSYRLVAPGLANTDSFGNQSATSTTAVPQHLTRGGVRVTYGYDWPWVGLHGGLLAYNAFDLVDPERPVYRSEWRGLPELLLRLGPVSPVRLELGLGSFNLPTITRPGAYLGLGFSSPAGSGWDLALHYAFVDNLNTIDYTRWDAELRAPVTDHLRVGAGVAVTSGFEGRIEPEGRLVMDFVLANPAGA